MPLCPAPRPIPVFIITNISCCFGDALNSRFGDYLEASKSPCLWVTKQRLAQVSLVAQGEFG